MISQEIANLVQRLEAETPALVRRDKRYRGQQPLRYAADRVEGDLKDFSVNICRIAVDAVAERMRVAKVTAEVRGRDETARATRLWKYSNLDQRLMPIIVDALALGATHLIVWPDQHGTPRIVPESAMQVTVDYHPITGEVMGAIKKWSNIGPAGNVVEDFLVHYTPEEVVTYSRDERGDWKTTGKIENKLGVVPVVPVINVDRIGDTGAGWSVIDDLGVLVDALSKVLADMLVASEDVARPRRWASGVDLEEDGGDDGFSADGAPGDPDNHATPAVSPFERGNRMFTVESPDAKFGQLPGADLQGYRTAVELIVQQIMSVSALPGHMLGVTTSNPSSADAIRAAEASLTSRAEARIDVLGLPLENALRLLVAQDLGEDVKDVSAHIHWGSPATKSTAQEADAVTKLFSLGILDREEARDMMGIGK